MENIEITSVSSRGQVVIPQSLRDRMKIHTGEKFVVIGENDTIVLKKLEMPSFNGIDKLLKKTRDFVKKKLHPADLKKAVARELNDFLEPIRKVFEKKNQDMKQLTAIENKIQKGQELNRADLVFLYEIDSAIQGFGYQKDPRIAELRSQRDPKADAPLVFDCEANQIAWGQNEITENTKAYIGPLFPNIFQIFRSADSPNTSSRTKPKFIIKTSPPLSFVSCRLSL